MANKKPETPEAAPITRAERSLGYALVSVLAMSIIAIIALFIAEPTQPKGMIWAVIAFLPTVGLAAVIILFIILMVLGIRRRTKANVKGAGK